MTNRVPQSQDDELYQLSKEQLVEIIKTLQEKIARLEETLNLDSKISSKPPSTDLIKKSEQKKLQLDADTTKYAQKPGGQPGHEGKTRKGFGRFDRIEILCAKVCPHCGGTPKRNCSSSDMPGDAEFHSDQRGHYPCGFFPDAQVVFLACVCLTLSSQLRLWAFRISSAGQWTEALKRSGYQ